MSSLLEKFAGKVDLIYIDPPFATGADFSIESPRRRRRRSSPGKEPSLLEQKAYRDTWDAGYDSYLNMMAERLALMRDLLAEIGIPVRPHAMCTRARI